jgi:hypothetical protein
MYLEKLTELEGSGIHFWPTLKECLGHADKVRNVQQLDDIAVRITKSPRPTTKEISYDDIEKEGEGVVKRTFADKSEHVYFLPTKINKKIEKPRTKFLWQEFIPFLKKYGELRVGISFEKVIWRVWTKATDDEGIHYEFDDITHPKRILNVPIEYNVYPIFCLQTSNTDTSRDLPDDPFDNDYNQIAPLYLRNLQEIDDFAIGTLRELVLLETASLGSEPSLTTFARLDLGIMADEHGIAQFFVNEVERLPNVTIWRGEHHAGPIAAAMDYTIYNVTLARLQSRVDNTSI